MSENTTPAPVVHPSIRERIERGVAWLDSVKPDWRTFIDQDALDITDAAYCVLGQVFDAEAADNGHDDGYDYVYEVYVPAGSGPWMTNHGFDSVSFAPAAYADLEAAWQRYLTDGMW